MQSIPATPSPLEFDALHMFTQASFVVQIVLVGLFLASILTWGIVLERWLVIAREKRAASRFERLFWSGQSLEEIERKVAARRPKPEAGDALLTLDLHGRLHALAEARHVEDSAAFT